MPTPRLFTLHTLRLQTRGGAAEAAQRPTHPQRLAQQSTRPTLLRPQAPRQLAAATQRLTHPQARAQRSTRPTPLRPQPPRESAAATQQLTHLQAPAQRSTLPTLLRPRAPRLVPAPSRPRHLGRLCTPPIPHQVRRPLRAGLELRSVRMVPPPTPSQRRVKLHRNRRIMLACLRSPPRRKSLVK
jgi:hypothetical protein